MNRLGVFTCLKVVLVMFQKTDTGSGDIFNRIRMYETNTKILNELIHQYYVYFMAKIIL